MRFRARLAVLVVTLVSAFIFSDAAATAAPSDRYTIITLEQSPPIVKTVESTQPGRTGSTAYFQADLTRNGKKIGALSGDIVVTDVTPETPGEEIRKRTLVFALRMGQIVALGSGRYLLAPVAGVPVLRSVTTTAIVGGTGAFSGARGQVRTIRHPDGSYTQVIMLLK